MAPKAKCTAKSKQTGKRCGQYPVPGCKICRFHGGKAPQVKEAAKRREEKQDAEKAVAIFGLPREVDPHTALLEELHRTAGHVGWLESIVAAGKLTKDQSATGKERTVKLDQATFGAGDQPSVWVALLQSERRHLLDVAKTCVAVGIEERRVRLAEHQGLMLANAIKGILTELGVADRPEVPGVVRRHLTVVAG